jgi:peptide/nickel transport system substrate-binding protein
LTNVQPDCYIRLLDRTFDRLATSEGIGMDPGNAQSGLTRRRLIATSAGALGAAALGPLWEAPAFAAGPKKGGTLRYAAGDAQSKDSLDPARALTSIGSMGLAMIYDNLLAVDPNWKLSPMLASQWSVSKNAKRYTFKIRKGITFHDGSPFTAKDVAFQFKRVLDKKVGSAGLSVLAPVLKPAGIKVPDPYTIVFELFTPDAFFGVRTTHYTLRIPKAGTTSWLKGSPGTGPFKNVSFKPGSGFQFVRNENYWMNGLPYLDGITGVGIPDQGTKVASLISGQSDICDSVPASAFDQITKSSSALLYDLKSSSPFTFDVDGSIKPYSDVRVQKAMKMSLDRKQLLDIVVGGHGVVSADSLISPTDPYYPADLKPFPHDPDQAKALLAQAGLPSGFTEDVWSTSAYPYLDQAAQIGKASMAQSGITLNVQSVSADQYLAAFLKKPIVMDYASRQHPLFMFQLYYASTSGSNLSRVKDAKIDGWIKEFQSTAVFAKQKELANEIIRRYNDVSAELIPFHFASYYGSKKRVKGLRPAPFSQIDFRRAYLA